MEKNELIKKSCIGDLVRSLHSNLSFFRSMLQGHVYSTPELLEVHAKSIKLTLELIGQWVDLNCEPYSSSDSESE